MKNKNLSWFAALLVFALLLWCTAVTPGKIADPSTYTCSVYSTIFSLLPPVIAIILALITKEAYSALFIGVLVGGLFTCGFAPVATLDTIVNDGLIAAIVACF